MEIYVTLANLSNDFSVLANSTTKKLKDQSKRSTEKANILKIKIEHDATQKTLKSGIKKTGNPDDDKQYEEHMAHHMMTHKDMPEYVAANKIAAQHRIALRKHISTLSNLHETKAALEPKYKKGTKAYHLQQATKLNAIIHREAREISDFSNSSDRSKGYKEREAKYRSVIETHPLNNELKLHIKKALKVQAKSTILPVPNNTLLWKNIKRDAKRKFEVFPSWVASQWMVQAYKKAGGTFA